MRLRALIAAALASIAIAAALSGCGSSAVVAGPLARAAYVTGHVERRPHAAQRARSKRPALRSAISMSGGGYFNFAAHEGSLSIQLAGLPRPALGSAPTMQEIFKGSDLYVGSPLFTGKLPGGASWMKVDLAQVEQAAGLDPSQLLSGQSNPAQFLEYLKASGASVTVVGHEPRPRRADHPLRRRRSTSARSPAALGGRERRRGPEGDRRARRRAELPVDVWVDSHNLVRRLQIDLPRHRRRDRTCRCRWTSNCSTSAPPRPSRSRPPSETFDATSTALGGLGSAAQ